MKCDFSSKVTLELNEYQFGCLVHMVRAGQKVREKDLRGDVRLATALRTDKEIAEYLFTKLVDHEN